MVSALKRELADIDDERILRRAEWDEFAVEEHPPYEYRKALAAFSRNALTPTCVTGWSAIARPR